MEVLGNGETTSSPEVYLNVTVDAGTLYSSGYKMVVFYMKKGSIPDSV